MSPRKNKKNPFYGKEVRMAEGIVYAPHCKCGAEGFGFHIVQDGEVFDPDDVEGAGCSRCGSTDLEWLPDGYSSGKTIKKGKKNG